MPYDSSGDLYYKNDRQAIHRLILWIVVVMLGIGAISVVGWRVGWWFKKANVEKQVEIDNSNKGTQQGWHDAAVKAVSDYTLINSANTAARGQLRKQACELIGKLQGTWASQDLKGFYSLQCV